MQTEITTTLKIGDAIIAEDVTVEIHANFRDFVNAAGDHDFELEDWDIMSVHWEGLTGIEARVEYPVRRIGHTEQQRELDRTHRQKISKMIENLRTFIPLTDADIEAQLVAQYGARR